MKMPLRTFGVLVGTAAVPLFIEPAAARLAVAVVCVGAAVATARRWMQGPAGAGDGRCAGAPAPLVTTDHLISEMRGAIEQTEQAVVDIGDRFMAISGRARAQLANVSSLRQELGGSGGAGGGIADRIDAAARETAALTDDINRIIVSLQFQDITRQRLERVIVQVQELQRCLDATRKRSHAS